MLFVITCGWSANLSGLGLPDVQNVHCFVGFWENAAVYGLARLVCLKPMGLSLRFRVAASWKKMISGTKKAEQPFR